MSMVSSLFSHHGIDLGSAIHPLPEDRTVPGAKGWKWIHTPGHSPGHISLFRPEDKVLIAGDTFLTVKQESVFAVATQHQVVHGPPSYFTTDWEDAEKSVRTLALLDPHIVLSGHGVPMEGENYLLSLLIYARISRKWRCRVKGSSCDFLTGSHFAEIANAPPHHSRLHSIPILIYLLKSELVVQSRSSSISLYNLQKSGCCTLRLAPV